MAKIKVHEIAKEIGVQSKDIVACLEANGVSGKTASSGLEEDQAELVRKKMSAKAPEAKAPEAKAPEAKATEAKAPETKVAEPQAPKAEPAKTPKPEAADAQKVAPKKKKIIIVSNKGGAQGGAKTPQASKPGDRNVARNNNNQGQRQGIIKPSIPTTAERAARLAETNQVSDYERIRRTSQANNKEVKESVQSSDAPVVNNNNSASSVAAGAGTAREPEQVEVQNVNASAPSKTEGNGANNNSKDNYQNKGNDRPARGDRDNKSFNQKSDKPFRGDRDNKDQRGDRGDRNGGDRDRRGGDRNDRNDRNQNRNDRFNNNRQGSNGNQQRQGQGKGGIVINQSKSYATDIPKDEKRAGNDRRGNSSKDKNKKDRLFENEDGFKGGKQIKGNKAKMLERPVEKKPEPEEEKIKVITLPENITIKDLADKMKIPSAQIIKKLFLQGQIVTVNQEVSYEQAEEIALEYEILCEKEIVVDVIEELLKEEEEDTATMSERPPVICVMGHVDHGKTSLLDAIRNTRVIDREAGGITQHIGAYVVEVNGKKITFLDTPGHEAFTAMRMRGANATDIAILVVAADDGVMPQTVEAINHAKAAGIEIIVAVNKIDKPSANIDRVKQELSEYELVAEDWGGSTVFAPVSAKTGEGIEELLEMILLTSDILELKANAKRKARGLVIEAQLDKGRGPVATILVQKGTLKVGDFIAAGASHGKVRAMIDDTGRRVKEAGPSTPVEILGLNDVPGAGEVFVSLDSDKEAKQFAETFIAQNKKKLLEDTKSKMSLDDLFSQIQAGNLKELNLIIKADVQGSVEAVKESLLKLSNEEVVVKVIHSGVGAINESDVILASASNAIIIGFNVRPDATAKNTAETENVDVRLYDVIYKAIEDIDAAMKGMLDPVFEEKVIGHAEIRQIFKASGIGNIAGSYVLDGMMQRGCLVRITRAGEQIYEGKLASLKRFKDDAKEVKQGFECGLVFEDFGDVQEFDIVEGYIMVEVPRT